MLYNLESIFLYDTGGSSNVTEIWFVVDRLTSSVKVRPNSIANGLAQIGGFASLIGFLSITLNVIH
jgi:hypothetical protein